MTGTDARFTVKTYVIPGVRNRYIIDKLVVGSFADSPMGSEFRGLVSVPIGRKTRAVLASWLIFCVLFFGAFVGVGTFNEASLRSYSSPLAYGIAGAILVMALATFVIALPGALMYAVTLRKSQRNNLNEVGSLAHFLEQIAREAESAGQNA